MNKFLIFMAVMVMSACSVDVGEKQLLSSGTYCEQTCENSQGQDGVAICHVPGPHEEGLSLCISNPGQLHGHVTHHRNDYCGPCEEEEGPDASPPAVDASTPEEDACSYPTTDASVPEEDAGCYGYHCNNTDAGVDAGEEPDAGGDTDAGVDEEPDAGVDEESDAGTGDNGDAGLEEDRDFTITGGGCSTSGDGGLGVAGIVFALGFLVGYFGRKIWKFLMPIIILIPLTFPSTANAQIEGDPGSFVLERYSPGLDEGAILNVEDGNVGPEGSWSLNAWVGYADDPLVIVDKATGERVNKLIDHQLSYSMGAYYVFEENAMVAVTLPMTLSQDRGAGAFATGSVDSFAMGDLKLDFKSQLTSQEKEGADLALDMFFALPTGKERAYASNESASFGFQFSLSKQFSKFRASTNLGFSKGASTQLLDLEISEQAFLRLGLATDVGPGELGLSLATHTSIEDFYGNTNTNYSEAILGYSKDYDGLILYSGVGRGLNEGYGAPDWRGMVGLRFTANPEKAPARVVTTSIIEDIVEPPVVIEPPVVVEKLLMTVTDAYFAFDSSEIKPRFKKKLVASAKSLMAAMNAKDRLLTIRVVGHTDSIGSLKYNHKLGFERATNVAKFFTEQGVIVTVYSKGETEQIDTNSTKKGRAKNRRVEIFVAGDTSDIEIEDDKTSPDEDTYDKFGKLNRVKVPVER